MLPNKLYKFFEKSCYAEEFISQGKIMLKPIEYFRTVEDREREDTTEGEGKLKVRGNVETITFHTETKKTIKTEWKEGYIDLSAISLNPAYIFCMSGPNVDFEKAKKKFGPYVVEIYCPDLFVDAVSEELKPYPLIRSECKPIRYDKGAITDVPISDMSPLEILDLIIFQKPESYEKEYEIRLAAKFEHTFWDQKCLLGIKLELKNPTQYVRYFQGE